MSMSLLISVYRFAGSGFQGTGLIKNKMKNFYIKSDILRQDNHLLYYKTSKGVHLVKSSDDKFN